MMDLSKSPLEPEWSPLSFLGTFFSLTLCIAILTSKPFCLPKPRRNKCEVPGHWGMQCEGIRVCGLEWVCAAVGGTVLWRRVNLGSSDNQREWVLQLESIKIVNLHSSLQECIFDMVSKSVPEYLSIAVLHKKRDRLWKVHIQNGIKTNCWLPTQKQK